jgi:hypothetical protein
MKTIQKLFFLFSYLIRLNLSVKNYVDINTKNRNNYINPLKKRVPLHPTSSPHDFDHYQKKSLFNYQPLRLKNNIPIQPLNEIFKKNDFNYAPKYSLPLNIYQPLRFNYNIPEKPLNDYQPLRLKQKRANSFEEKKPLENYQPLRLKQKKANSFEEKKPLENYQPLRLKQKRANSFEEKKPLVYFQPLKPLGIDKKKPLVKVTPEIIKNLGVKPSDQFITSLLKRIIKKTKKIIKLSTFQTDSVISEQKDKFERILKIVESKKVDRKTILELHSINQVLLFYLWRSNYVKFGGLYKKSGKLDRKIHLYLQLFLKKEKNQVQGNPNESLADIMNHKQFSESSSSSSDESKDYSIIDKVSQNTISEEETDSLKNIKWIWKENSEEKELVDNKNDFVKNTVEESDSSEEQLKPFIPNKDNKNIKINEIGQHIDDISEDLSISTKQSSSEGKTIKKNDDVVIPIKSSSSSQEQTIKQNDPIKSSSSSEEQTIKENDNVVIPLKRSSSSEEKTFKENNNVVIPIKSSSSSEEQTIKENESVVIPEKKIKKVLRRIIVIETFVCGNCLNDFYLRYFVNGISKI